MDTSRVGRAVSGKQRRYRTDSEKRQIVGAAREPEASVSVVARRFGVNANLVFKWLKDPRYGGAPDPVDFLPVEVGPPVSKTEPATSDGTPLPPPQILEERAGIIEIDLACGSRVRVDAHVNDRALARVLRILRAAG